MSPAVMKDMVTKMIIRHKNNLSQTQHQKKKLQRNSFQRRSLKRRKMKNWLHSQEAWVLMIRKQMINNKIIKKLKNQPLEITCLKIRKRSRSKRKRLLRKLRKQRKMRKMKSQNKMRMEKNSPLRRNKQLSVPPQKRGNKSKNHLLTIKVIWLLS